MKHRGATERKKKQQNSKLHSHVCLWVCVHVKVSSKLGSYMQIKYNSRMFVRCESYPGEKIHEKELNLQGQEISAARQYQCKQSCNSEMMSV